MQVAEVKSLARQLPAETGTPLSRWSCLELVREAVGWSTAGSISPSGIAPFMNLVTQAMTTEPYASARRVFWATAPRASPPLFPADQAAGGGWCRRRRPRSRRGPRRRRPTKLHIDKGYDCDHGCRCLRQPGTTSLAKACGQVPPRNAGPHPEGNAKARPRQLGQPENTQLTGGLVSGAARTEPDSADQAMALRDAPLLW